MEYREVVEFLAPCGLNCRRCADFSGGRIKELSQDLIKELGNYAWVAKVKSARNPVMAKYQDFAEVLDSFAGVSCGGCRTENVKCTIDCSPRLCTREKGIDFCFQCTDYPCEKPGPNRQRWLKINDRMKEVGVVDYFEEQEKAPRY